PDGFREGVLRVKDGLIAELLPYDAALPGLAVEDAGDAVVMPGVVDTHVHVNEPGRTEWEGFETATRAAASGGITSLVDMPLNSSPVTTTLAALAAKRAATSGKLWVDVGFWGGVVPGNQDELRPMIEAGICGFKAFLCHSGIDDFPQATEADLRVAMPILAQAGVPLLVHAELEPADFSPPEGDPRAYATFLASRPATFEVEAVKMMIALCRETRCPVHIVHLAAAEALPLIAAAKAEGLPMSVETCPHYLVFASEEIPDGQTHFKCCPPIRDTSNRERLWAGLADGTIDFVACDHSPCTPHLKRLDEGDFMAAWGGISGLQFALGVVWTAARARGFALEQVLPWVTDRTARFAGLAGRKGAIAPGHDADLLFWRPDETFTIAESAIHHRHPLTPYAGMTLHGVVEKTMLRGETVYAAGAFAAGPFGRMLERDRAPVSAP
ncbi:MAG: allantoinase AllB, partial [Candidatus Sericytochromatia bacterium]